MVIDGKWRDSLIVIDTEGEVVIEDLILRRGSAGALGQAGSLSVYHGDVTVRRVWMERGRGGTVGGVAASHGRLTMEQCRLEAHGGQHGSALDTTGIADVTLRDCVVTACEGPAAALAVSVNATLNLDCTSVIRNSCVALEMMGHTLTVEDSIIDGELRGSIGDLRTDGQGARGDVEWRCAGQLAALWKNGSRSMVPDLEASPGMRLHYCRCAGRAVPASGRGPEVWQGAWGWGGHSLR